MALPQLGAYAQALIEPIMVVAITFAGIIMLFGACGMKISSNIGSTIIEGVFKAARGFCRMICNVIGWIVRNTFRVVPHLYNGSRQTLKQLGMNDLHSALLSGIIVIIFLIVVI